MKTRSKVTALLGATIIAALAAWSCQPASAPTPVPTATPIPTTIEEADLLWAPMPQAMQNHICHDWLKDGKGWTLTFPQDDRTYDLGPHMIRLCESAPEPTIMDGNTTSGLHSRITSATPPPENSPCASQLHASSQSPSP